MFIPNKIIHWKNILLLLVFLSTLCSCNKYSLYDPADIFVGTYTFTDNYYVKWGNDSKTITSSGSFKLTKISSNQVQMTGAWNTTGTISGNEIFFQSCIDGDTNGYITYIFGTGTLYKTQLNFTYSGSGSLKYNNGITYPLNINGNIISTKIIHNQQDKTTNNYKNTRKG